MSIVIGSNAPDSTWPVAWINGAAAPMGMTTSLSSYSGKVVVLYFAEIL